MSIDLEQFEASAKTIGEEHRAAIRASETSGKELAHAERDYLAELVATIPAESQMWGKTLAENMAKGQLKVREKKAARDIAAAKDRAAMERVRLARDDRQALLAIAAWSRANEAVE